MDLAFGNGGKMPESLNIGLCAHTHRNVSTRAFWGSFPSMRWHNAHAVYLWSRINHHAK